MSRRELGMTAAYSMIEPPFTLKFSEMSRKELRDYFKWFQDVIPQRIGVLSNAVKDSPGFEDWRPDYTPTSLNALGNWFATEVHTRPRTQDERNQIARSPFSSEMSDWELTTRTISLAMDVAMYLSEVLLRNHPALHWDQEFGSKRYIDYGKPVLAGFVNDVPC